MSILWISREEKTKHILLTRDELILPDVDSQFDVPECKFFMKNSSSKCWHKSYKIEVIFGDIDVFGLHGFICTIYFQIKSTFSSEKKNTQRGI